ncbi:hypothetical protein CsSME_00039795 [Camellia sinensis var. sinensis]
MPRTFWDCPERHCLYPRKRSQDPRKILKENLMAFRVRFTRLLVVWLLLCLPLMLLN